MREVLIRIIKRQLSICTNTRYAEVKVIEIFYSKLKFRGRKPPKQSQRTALFIDYLLENRINVISVTKGIDSANENDDLSIGFKQIVNDLYAKDISKKVRAGIRQKQKSVLVVNLPMGYYKDRNTNEIKIDEQCAECGASLIAKKRT